MPWKPKSAALRPAGNTSLEVHAYGNPAIFRAIGRKDVTDIPIFPIDDLDDARGKCVAYNETNDLLEGAKNCICIGLSEDGFRQSHLDFSKIDKVFYSGDEIEGDQFKNFIPLNQYADAIVAGLSE